MGQSAAQKAKAKSLTAKRKVEKAAAEVAAAREAAKDLDVTSADAWQSSTVDERDPVKLMLPSGNVCLAVNPGLEAFIEQGMIPNELMPIVMRAVNEGKGMNGDEVAELGKDPQMLRSVLTLTNAVVCHTVLEPKVNPVPEDGKRTKGLLYIDQVDLEDKFFILQWVVGGTRDLERFREQQAALVGDVPAGEAVEQETE